MDADLLKLLEKPGYYLRHTVQNHTGKSFGIQLMNNNDELLTHISHRFFDPLVSQGYIVRESSRRVHRAHDLRFKKYVLYTI